MYNTAVSQLSIVHNYGWHGVQINKDSLLEPLPFVWRILSQIGGYFASGLPDDISQFVRTKVAGINYTHAILDSSDKENVSLYFQSAQLFRDWNEFVSRISDQSMQVSYDGCISTSSNHFPKEFFECAYYTDCCKPLVVSPKGETGLIEWAQNNQDGIAQELKAHGAIIFRGFGLQSDNFATAFEAITGKAPVSYPGDTPRKEVSPNIYTSTAVAPAHTIPLHQEVAAHPEVMPDYIAFYCKTAPQKGTGQTTLGDVKAVTEDIKKSASDIWDSLTQRTLTYIARYLPDGAWLTKWIQLLNPSHANISRHFKTADRSEIESICSQRDFTCTWDKGWAIVTRSNVPGTMDLDGEKLFCNQVHLDKFSPGLVGGKLNYMLGRTVLYPTKEFNQFDVEYSDGTPFGTDIGDRLLSILKKHEIVMDWEEGDLKLVDNHRMMHGKKPHRGPREIHVAMA